MKKFYSILSIAIAFSMLALTTSCSDDDEESINRTEVLTSKKWSPTKFEAEAPGVPKTDVTEEYTQYQEECDKDDYTTFSKDGVMKFEVGEDDCDGDAETETSEWSWKDGEKILVLDGDEYTVVSMSASTIVLKQDMSEGAYLYVTFTGK